MEKFNEKLKKRILEEIYETCVKKEFLKHEKTEYNISALEKHYCKIQRTKIYQH